MKNSALLLLILTLCYACKKDDSPSCISCSSPETVPFEVCREGNGNASVNGQDTGTSYDQYMADLEATGVTCGI
jgi:hypothetical protein